MVASESIAVLTVATIVVSTATLRCTAPYSSLGQRDLRARRSVGRFIVCSVAIPRNLKDIDGLSYPDVALEGENRGSFFDVLRISAIGISSIGRRDHRDRSS